MRDLFIYLGIAFVPVTLILTGLCLGARDRAIRAEATLREIALSGARRGAVPQREDADVYRALDAIALEVERIAEAQRFSAKLLAERVGERAEA